jgi:hypothetical protein
MGGQRSPVKILAPPAATIRRLSSNQMTPPGFEHCRKLAKDPQHTLNTLRRLMPKGTSARGLLLIRRVLRPC